MPSPTELDALAGLAAAQHGVVAVRQLASIGLTRSASRHLVSSGRWSHLTDEVLRLRGSRWTDASAAMAAVLDAGRGARLSHQSGGNRWGLSCSLRPFHVVTTSASRRRTSLARTHKVRELPDTWTTFLDGIPIVRPELLALQIYATSDEGRAEVLVERLWSLRLLSGRSIAAFLAQLGRRGRDGTAGLRRYLDERGEDYEPTASNLETRTMQILRSAGIHLRRQVDSGGEHWTGRVDFRHGTLPLILEVQSEMYHRALRDSARDAERVAQLIADRFTVVEVTDEDVFLRPWIVTAKVRAAIDGLRP